MNKDEHMVEFPKELLKEFIVGNPECKMSIGDRVIKINSEEGDLHTDGEEATIVGNYKKWDMEVYLIHYDNDAKDHVTFVSGERLIKIV